MVQFRNFPVYIESEAFYSQIQPLLSNTNISYSLRDQLDRAATSILLNIAEGTGKFGYKDKKNFYAIARGSTNECHAILRIIYLRNLINESFHTELEQKLDSIGKMLSGLIRTMRELNSEK